MERATLVAKLDKLLVMRGDPVKGLPATVWAESLEGVERDDLLRAGIEVVRTLLVPEWASRRKDDPRPQKALEAVESEYPVEHLPPWLDLLSSSLHPDAPRGEALRRIGFEWMTSFKKPEGHSLEQAMTRLPGSFGRMGNFFDFEVRQITPHGFVATIGDVACLHTFFLGMLEGVTSSTAPTRHEVRWAPAGLSGARYELTAPFRG